jgi:hypothetical protein
MPALTLTVNTISPQLDKRHQEVQVIQRALDIAESQIRQAGGTVVSGTMTDAGVTLGTWTYTPAASS